MPSLLKSISSFLSLAQEIILYASSRIEEAPTPSDTSIEKKEDSTSEGRREGDGRHGVEERSAELARLLRLSLQTLQSHSLTPSVSSLVLASSKSSTSTPHHNEADQWIRGEDEKRAKSRELASQSAVIAEDLLLRLEWKGEREDEIESGGSGWRWVKEDVAALRRRVGEIEGKWKGAMGGERGIG